MLKKKTIGKMGQRNSASARFLDALMATGALDFIAETDLNFMEPAEFNERWMAKENVDIVLVDVRIPEHRAVSMVDTAIAGDDKFV